MYRGGEDLEGIVDQSYSFLADMHGGDTLPRARQTPVVQTQERPQQSQSVGRNNTRERSHWGPRFTSVRDLPGAQAISSHQREVVEPRRPVQVQEIWQGTREDQSRRQDFPQRQQEPRQGRQQQQMQTMEERRRREEIEQSYPAERQESRMRHPNYMNGHRQESNQWDDRQQSLNERSLSRASQDQRPMQQVPQVYKARRLESYEERPREVSSFTRAQAHYPESRQEKQWARMEQQQQQQSRGHVQRQVQWENYYPTVEELAWEDANQYAVPIRRDYRESANYPSPGRYMEEYDPRYEYPHERDRQQWQQHQQRQAPQAEVREEAPVGRYVNPPSIPDSKMNNLRSSMGGQTPLVSNQNGGSALLRRTNHHLEASNRWRDEMSKPPIQKAEKEVSNIPKPPDMDGFLTFRDSSKGKDNLNFAPAPPPMPSKEAAGIHEGNHAINPRKTVEGAGKSNANNPTRPAQYLPSLDEVKEARLKLRPMEGLLSGRDKTAPAVKLEDSIEMALVRNMQSRGIVPPRSPSFRVSTQESGNENLQSGVRPSVPSRREEHESNRNSRPSNFVSGGRSAARNPPEPAQQNRPNTKSGVPDGLKSRKNDSDV